MLESSDYFQKDGTKEASYADLKDFPGVSTYVWNKT